MNKFFITLIFSFLTANATTNVKLEPFFSYQNFANYKTHPENCTSIQESMTCALQFAFNQKTSYTKNLAPFQTFNSCCVSELSPQIFHFSSMANEILRQHFYPTKGNGYSSLEFGIFPHFILSSKSEILGIAIFSIQLNRKSNFAPAEKTAHIELIPARGFEHLYPTILHDVCKAYYLDQSKHPIKERLTSNKNVLATIFEFSSRTSESELKALSDLGWNLHKHYFDETVLNIKSLNADELKELAFFKNINEYTHACAHRMQLSINLDKQL